jgi:hypothetical protein
MENSTAEFRRHLIRLYKKDGLHRKKAEQKVTTFLRNTPHLYTPKGRQAYVEQFIDGFRNLAGICSFTTKPSNLLMWAHYADFHKGICLQFDFPDHQSIVQPPAQCGPLFVVPVKVTYAEKRPEFPIFNRTANDVENYFTTKSTEWDYEDEYRAVIPNYIGTAPYDPKFLTGIILGCRTTAEDVNEVKTLTKEMFWEPRLYKAVQKKDLFGLDYNPL